MSTTKLSHLSGWDYAPTDVLDVQARTLYCSPAVSNNELTVSSRVPPESIYYTEDFNAANSGNASTQNSPIGVSPFGGARVEPDVYCAVETYRGVALRFTEDPKRPGAVRVYVESPIDWKGRDSSAHPTHLWPTGHDGRPHPPYLCIKAEHAPTSYEKAKGLAETWVRGTQHYIATGRTITDRINNGETI